MRLLLDAHVSPAVARGLQSGGVDAVAVRDWQGGAFRSAPDDRLLEAAALEGRVLVSYDCRTLPPLLKEWAESGQHHGGVILVDEKTVRPNDVGGLIRALHVLAAANDELEWEDRVLFVQARSAPFHH